ncbi:MAG TPA: lysine transporter LysE [Rhodospirillaceae bacterium]|nr:lysine transporter LysE [Rhodospirillaceae bacterium]
MEILNLDFVLFLKAIGIGFSIAAPVGPVAMLCIQRSLKTGWWPGFFTGLGAAAADTFYAAIAVFGLAAALTALFDQSPWIQPVCGIILIVVGTHIFREKPSETSGQRRVMKAHHMAGNWLSAFVITLLNPATILAFLAVFGGLKIADGVEDPVQGLTTVGGVFVGAAIWWIGLTTVAAVFHHQIQPKTMLLINRLGGLVVFGFGVFALVDWGMG